MTRYGTVRGQSNGDRIADYFSSSIMEVAGEALESMGGPVRVVCNSDLDLRDVETARAARLAIGLRGDNEVSPAGRRGFPRHHHPSFRGGRVLEANALLSGRSDEFSTLSEYAPFIPSVNGGHFPAVMLNRGRRAKGPARTGLAIGGDAR